MTRAEQVPLSLLDVQATFGASHSNEAGNGGTQAATSSLKSFVPGNPYSGATNLVFGNEAAQPYQCSPGDFAAVARLLKPLLDKRKDATLAEIRAELGLQPKIGATPGEVSGHTHEGAPAFVMTATTQVCSAHCAQVDPARSMSLEIADVKYLIHLSSSKKKPTNIAFSRP